MPTYEYECTSCAKHFDFFQNINDPLKESCPACGKKLKRLIGSGSGIIFKGSGFYATDYRKKEENRKHNDQARPCSSCPSGGTCENKKD